MRFLSLFSGIEACSAAWLPLGWECAAFAEIEPLPCAVLKHHYPEVPIRGKPAADGPRYKAIGNSMCVNVMRWIGEKIQSVGIE